MAAEILYSSGNDIGTFTDYDRDSGDASAYNTGDLRRRYNFGKRISELNIPQDPFFRLVSKVRRDPTDDPTFKYIEKRPSWHKRYAYPMGHVVTTDDDSFDDATLQNYNGLDDGSNETIAAGDTVKIYFATDYKSEGNLQNVYGNSNNKIDVGDAGTAPIFFLPNQLVKVNLSATADGGTAISDYMVFRVDTVGDAGDKTIQAVTRSVVLLTGTVVKAASGEYTSYTSNVPIGAAADFTVYSKVISTSLEPMRSYVISNVWGKGTGVPQTWNDQPFLTSYGQTQIVKTALAMTNTDRATVLKLAPNEWERIWKEKLIEHKWDLEEMGLFSAQSGTYRTTQGAVDFIVNHGNVFSLNTATKDSDDFLIDMSSYFDPRYNQAGATVFMCDTDTYNWLHKIGGYFGNNVDINTQFRADLTVQGRGKLLGLATTKIFTPYGDMNVMRNIHLDGSSVKMLGINLKNVKYRPLKGNGLNRDTSIYVGVQTLENTGIDKRVDLILTEAGYEWSCPESHAMWS
ncbi:MAG: hypothetical protein HN932_12920 [Candidatus Marinimicrobia bacterium]|jgi:hypothetical protein|nr:hypothetical protein [Candidatus Neomarinimicrobiota bacterium]MBT7339117.1 hypothetical protein [Candidatus Jacksonbacteria bacterium]